MPRITVKFYPPLSEKAGRGEVPAEGHTAGEALRDLADRLGGAFAGTLFEEGKPKRYFTFVLNQKILDPGGMEGEPVHEKDVLHVYPPIAGG